MIDYHSLRRPPSEVQIGPTDQNGSVGLGFRRQDLRHNKVHCNEQNFNQLLSELGWSPSLLSFFGRGLTIQRLWVQILMDHFVVKLHCLKTPKRKEKRPRMANFIKNV